MRRRETLHKDRDAAIRRAMVRSVQQSIPLLSFCSNPFLRRVPKGEERKNCILGSHLTQKQEVPQPFHPTNGKQIAMFLSILTLLVQKHLKGQRAINSVKCVDFLGTGTRSFGFCLPVVIQMVAFPRRIN